MNILGINGAIGWDSSALTNPFENNGQLSPDIWVHGASACLISGNQLVGALGEERLTRQKYNGNYPINAINALLSKANITVDEIDIVTYVGNCTSLSTDLRRNGYIQNVLKQQFPNAEIVLIDHHNAHIGATFLTSSFERANVFTFDGLGDLHYFKNWGNNSTFSIATRTPFSVLKTYNSYSDFNTFTLGSFFNSFSFYCLAIKTQRVIPNNGIHRESSAGKVMGMSAYGNLDNVSNLQNPFIVSQISKYDTPVIHNNPYVENSNQEYLKFNNVKAEDLALWIQKVFEDTVCEFLKKIPKNQKTDNLCLGGGCALNILTNSKIISEGIYEDVHVSTAPNDDGLSLGATLLTAIENNINVELPENIGCLGIEYDDHIVEQALLGSSQIQYDRLSDEALYSFIASRLKENNIVAWHRGKSEFGPRALGNRSIFANPSYHNKDRLNTAVKFREEWRPYAAIIMEECLSEWVDIPKKNSRYMLFSGIVRENKRTLIPSVTHADNTCRIQTVTFSVNEGAYRLLNEFNKLTGIPLLLNTSFNTIPGEPIVETPQDAIESFLHSQINYLVINNFVITRK